MSRVMFMIALVFAGEQVFGLPFHTQRFFKSTFLDVFNISNTQLGDLFAVYGIMAMIAYFPGGALADRLLSALIVGFLFGCDRYWRTLHVHNTGTYGPGNSLRLFRYYDGVSILGSAYQGNA